jgi:hypothetical protein
MEVSVAIPEIILDKRSIQYEVAIVNNKKLKLDTEIDIKSSERLPYLSDNLPKIGENMRCIKANIVIKRLKATAPKPKDLT